MLRPNKPTAIDPNHPAYYAELLSRVPRLERSCPEFPGIQELDDPLALRLQTLLCVVADISLCHRGNVSATMARLRQDDANLETDLYVVFNSNDESASRCPEHLGSIFSMLRQVPYNPPSMEGSTKVIADQFKENLVEVAEAIHNYSFEIFAYRVNKRRDKLSDVEKYIKEDQTHFKPVDRSALLDFLQQVGLIVKTVARTQAAKRPLSTVEIQMFLKIYWYWKDQHHLPEDVTSDHKATLLDGADTWLAEKHGVGFQLRRWALKIMSFVISTHRLFTLTQSRRLRRILDGKFIVKVLAPPTTNPYCFDLSSKTVKIAVDAALNKTPYSSALYKDDRGSFIENLQSGQRVERWRPTVHAEIAMIGAIVTGEIKDVMPYIGVSKLSCLMCIHYIRAYRAVTRQQITTKGSHGKAYPGWFWPRLPHYEKKLRKAFMTSIKTQLCSDFEQHANARGKPRQKSNSSVGSGLPDFEERPTKDEIFELFNNSTLAESSATGSRGQGMSTT